MSFPAFARGSLSAIAIALLITGCGDPKLDGTTEQAFKESIEKAAAKLPPDQQKQFRDDLVMLAFQGLNFGAILRGEGEKAGVDSINQVRQSLNGKTATEVMAEAARVRSEREQKEREQALAEIQDLLNQQATAEAAKSELAKFKVTKSRFYFRKDEYSYRPEPVIELDVTNDTGKPVSRAYFKGTIASPGRSVPWLVDTFNYEISGGLEPGETASWKLAPNMFSDWGKVDAPADAVFTVEVYRLDGADKVALFNAEGLSESKQTRLKSLQEKYAR